MSTLPAGARAHVDRILAEGTDDLRCTVARVRESLVDHDQADVVLMLVGEIQSVVPAASFGMLISALLELAKLPLPPASPAHSCGDEACG